MPFLFEVRLFCVCVSIVGRFEVWFGGIAFCDEGFLYESKVLLYCVVVVKGRKCHF